MLVQAHHLGGSLKQVEVLAVDRGRKVAQIWWPIAGLYEARLSDGAIFNVHSEKKTPWRIENRDLRLLKNLPG